VTDEFAAPYGRLSTGEARVRQAFQSSLVMQAPTQNAVNHQAKLDEIMSKYTGSGVVRRNRTWPVIELAPCGGALSIQDLVRKMRKCSGLNVI
jgi:hypothetical protein